MIKRLLRNYSDRFLSRWVVLLFDVAVSMLALPMAALVRNQFDYLSINPYALQYQALEVGLVMLLLTLITGAHSGIIRHTSERDALKVLQATFGTFVFLAIFSTIGYALGRGHWSFIPRSILLVHFMLTAFMLLGSRFMVKLTYIRFIESTEVKKKRVIIYGAGASGLITKNTLKQDTSRHYEVVAFIDDNPNKIGKSLEGIVVYSSDKVLNNGFLEKHEVQEIIISIQALSPDRRRAIVERCIEKGVDVKVVPPVDKWIHGELSTKQIRNVRIEELLEREPIKLNSLNVSKELKGKVVLVTGAAGSIGSEIARQVAHYGPARLVMLDQAESALYDLEQELKQLPIPFAICEFVIADVTNKQRIQKVFNHYRPHVVYHAAAYKHVPLMEVNPTEAISVNVLGTRTVVDLSCEFQAEKFVMVSTDKAVNPTNVMGASKRAAEIYVQAKAQGCELANHKTQFITTRFGNVLGSNGSVIPLFKKQIENGGPITVTHPDITRYFMTIPEACNLVLEAGAMGNGGEIYVFDMGRSVKIIDLAKKMIRLSGLQEGRDIKIEYTGLRPGEKLYEELLADEENTKATHHPKIMIANTRDNDPESVDYRLRDLESRVARGDNMELVRSLKALVPEYKSQNSEFELLD